MNKDICLGTIMNDYIIEKSKDESFTIADQNYLEDILKLAQLCNRDMSTFSFESKKDINKVLWMIDLNKRESILKSFLEDYYLTKYNLVSDFNIFLTKEVMSILLKKTN